MSRPTPAHCSSGSHLRFRARQRPFGASLPHISHSTSHSITHAVSPTTCLSTECISPPTSYTRRDLILTSASLAGLALLPRPPPATAKPITAAVDPGDWSSPGLGAPVDPFQPRFVKLFSGVRFQDLNVGSGPVAGPGDMVLFDYVLRRSNGYFIYSTVEGVSFQPLDVPTAPVSCKLGSGELIAVRVASLR